MSAQAAISRDGTRIAVRVWGPPEAPPVVLVHGLGLSMGSWDPVPELLARDHRVVAYDLRGHGHSGLSRTGDYALPAHAADLAAVLEQTLPGDARAVAVGNSFGGAVILEHARGAAETRLRGVVFAGSSGSTVTLPGLPANALPGWATSLLRSAWLQTLRGAAHVATRLRPLEPVTHRLVRQAAFASPAHREEIERVRRDFFATPPEALAKTVLASGSRDGSELASRLRVPALVLHGENDPEIPLERIEKLMTALPCAELVTLRGAGHMLPMTHAHEVAGQIARWVKRVSGGRPA